MLNPFRSLRRLVATSAFALICAVGVISLATADQVMPDGDTADNGKSPAVFGSGTGAYACTATAPGEIVVKYTGAENQPSQHFTAGEDLGVTFTPEDPKISAALVGGTPSVPDPWDGDSPSFAIDIETSIDDTIEDDKQYKVYVDVVGAESGYSAQSDAGGRPFFMVNVNCDPDNPPPPTNHAPTVSANNSSVTVNEGATATNSGTFGDSDGDPVNLSASVGTVTPGSGGTWSWSYATTDGPSQSQTVTITASDGTAQSQAQFALGVNNVAPVIDPLSLSGNSGVACLGGNSVGLQFSFDDAGVNDSPWTGAINWGDTNSTSLSLNSRGLQTGYSHTYGAGSFTPSVTLTDKDTGSDTETATTGSVSFLYSTGSGILQPINADKSSNFKLGSVFPIKIKITDCNGAPVGSGIQPRVKLSRYQDLAGAEAPNETTEASVPDAADLMRFDGAAGQWIYNLSSKKTSLYPSGALPLGKYKVTVYSTPASFTAVDGYFDIVK